MDEDESHLRDTYASLSLMVYCSLNFINQQKTRRMMEAAATAARMESTRHHRKLRTPTSRSRV